jgi:SAM-dependent methyltransferase
VGEDGRVTEDYIALNRDLWNERADAHARSPEYALDRFAADPAHLSRVVRFDQPLLGDVAGLRGVHLQCHIGTDTLSLARLGADMTGLDFSAASLAVAARLAERAGPGVRWVEGVVEDAVTLLGAGGYDLVYTGIGALGWLPAIRPWARTVAALLRPGGRLFMREGHPVLWALTEPRPDGLLVLEFPYWERPEPMIWESDGTYVTTDTRFAHTRSAEWNHGLGEIVQALLDAGLVLTGLVEHDSVPWNALPGQMTELDNGEWRLTDRPWRLPHSYTLQARRPG